MIALIDYGVGNLFSIKRSLSAVGAETCVTGNPDEIRNADKILLPGVGAFADASRKLRESGLADVIVDEAKKGKPILGICLGMQLLFDKSYEYGEHEGLGLIKGEIRPISEIVPTNLKIPHIGWNALHFQGKKSQLLKYNSDGDFVYFVHSYSARSCQNNVIATAEYGSKIVACVESGNVFGCQFHPEKSGDAGLNILRAFNDMEG